ncbi:hypothetical protein R8Z50_11325 [Longispora sp. K20-0274]|uniref:hypothetical protein n=1 Tax=Longispora sp. K20-0274 TaxID=3088255 RepID=UPI00399B5E73
MHSAGRRRWLHERPTPDLPEQSASADQTEDRLALMAALQGLGRQQRASVVLDALPSSSRSAA